MRVLIPVSTGSEPFVYLKENIKQKKEIYY